jgi:hypothetical protein
MAIPKRIFAVWLNDDPKLPEIVGRCLTTQRLPGYEHRLIGLDSPEWKEALSKSRYLQECAPTKRWVKAADFFRMWLLYKYGGIYLDSDMEVLPGKNFDDMLDTRMFISYEFNSFYANSAIGAEPGHPMLKKYMGLVERNFRGDGEMIFGPGMQLWRDCFYGEDLNRLGVKVYPTETFFPFNHLTNATLVTPLTRVFHYCAKNWSDKEWEKA